jgi:hypothetical protein
MNVEQLQALRIEYRAKLELLDKILGNQAVDFALSQPAPPLSLRPVATAPALAAEAPPRPKAPSPRPTGGNHRVLHFAEVAKHMADGPKGIGYLRDVLRSDPKTIKKCLEKHNLLFRKAFPLDRLSPWELTEEGRKELAG